MAHSLASFVSAKGRAAALVDERGELTWYDLDQRVNRLIQGFWRRGLETGARIAILCGNRREYFEVMVAALHGGLVIVPVDWHCKAAEVVHIMTDSGAVGLVTESPFADVAEAASAGLSQVRLRVMIGDEVRSGFMAYEEFLAANSSREPDGQCVGGLLPYTSGTTGRPKGVVSTIRPEPGGDVSLVQQGARGFARLVGLPADGRTLLCAPVYHSAQLVYSLQPLFCGHCVVMRRRFDAVEILRLIDAWQITNTHMVPIHFVRLLKHENDASRWFRGDSLQIVWHAGAPCPLDIKRRMIAWWGAKIVEYYGGTGTGVITRIDADEWQEHPMSVGKPQPSVEIHIYDDDGRPAPPMTPGSIYIKGKTGVDITYFNNPEETASIHRSDGSFTLGDVGYLDEDGYLVLVGRDVDIIISGGVNIYPAEIESALMSHPAVGDVAVFGIPNDEFGEEVKAVVEPRESASRDDVLPDDLRRHCEERLASYKVPRTFEFVTSLPRTPAGKLAKKRLRAPYWKGRTRKI